MSATINFIKHAVGDGMHNHHSDVRSLQKLLIAAGIQVQGGADGGWGKHTGDALVEYQKKKGAPEKRQVNPGDDILTQMAADAKIVLPLPAAQGLSGLLQTHKWFTDNGIKYQQGAESGGGNRAIYGVEGDKRYA